MQRKSLFPIAYVVAIFFSMCSKMAPGGSNKASNYDSTGISVLTQHNNNYRTGWNNNEYKLKVSNVNSQTFGKLFTLTVDDQVYSQPLVVANLSISGGIHNTVFIATVSNSVYAFDGSNGSLYWHKNYTVSGMRPPKNTDMTGACGGQYEDFTGNIGIVGTPVIDSTKGIMYFVARSTNEYQYVQYLHAISIVSGNEIPGSPVEIQATYPGTGDGSVNNVLTYDPQKSNQRAALTLSNGIVYITNSSHCDWGPYHGWILGYNATTLKQQIVFNTTPNDGDGGIWQSGGGMAVDDQGNLYTGTGNGDGNVPPTDGKDFGESALKLTPSGNTLTVSSYFTPFNYPALDYNDLDFGSFGSFLIPNTSLFFTGGKDGNLYLLNKDNMGGFNSAGNNVYDNVFINNSNAQYHCLPSYYHGTSVEYIYIWSENDYLRAIPFDRSSMKLNAANQVLGVANGPAGGNGANISVSSNGSIDSTAIIWATYADQSCDAGHQSCPGILRAFKASDPSYLIWDSNTNPANNLGTYAKFNAPTIANGYVYVPTFSNQVVVYGLKQ